MSTIGRAALERIGSPGSARIDLLTQGSPSDGLASPRASECRPSHPATSSRSIYYPVKPHRVPPRCPRRLALATSTVIPHTGSLAWFALVSSLVKVPSFK